MARARRFQIPVNDDEDGLIHKAAKLNKLPAAEWARRHLIALAEKTLKGTGISAIDAVKTLGELNAPVGSVEEMNRETSVGRYGDL